mmetsp:Transcript_3520/g.8939  ORF Transcript_3520/g.8939 Transcript_3520/m.8939 type:complete len:276 (-) Transcript_3520:60-887(-)
MGMPMPMPMPPSFIMAAHPLATTSTAQQELRAISPMAAHSGLPFTMSLHVLQKPAEDAANAVIIGSSAMAGSENIVMGSLSAISMSNTAGSMPRSSPWQVSSSSAWQEHTIVAISVVSSPTQGDSWMAARHLHAAAMSSEDSAIRDATGASPPLTAASAAASLLMNGQASSRACSEAVSSGQPQASSSSPPSMPDPIAGQSACRLNMPEIVLALTMFVKPDEVPGVVASMASKMAWTIVATDAEISALASSAEVVPSQARRMASFTSTAELSTCA